METFEEVGYDMGDWIKCHCEQWIHEDCIDYDIKEPFICQKNVYYNNNSVINFVVLTYALYHL